MALVARALLRAASTLVSPLNPSSIPAEPRPQGATSC